MGTDPTNFTSQPPPTLFCSRCGASVSANDRFCPSCAAPQSAEALVYGFYRPAPVRTYAGFWIRFAAYVIDAILVGIVLSPISILSGLTFSVLPGHQPDFALGAVVSVMGTAILLGTAVVWLYEALMTSSSKQATVGKMVFGLVVTDLTGRRLSFAHATGRHFAKYLSGMVMGLGYIMAGFTERKQALHDFICGTCVLNGPASR